MTRQDHDRIVRSALADWQRWHEMYVRDKARERERRERRERQVRALIESAHGPRVPASDAELRELLVRSIELAKGRNGVSIQEGDEA